MKFKFKILAIAALLTVCSAAPATAETDVDFGVTLGERAGIVIIPSRRRDRDYYPHDRDDWHRRPRYRIHRPDDYRYYGYDRFDPYRYGRRSRHRHRHGRYYYPRRGNSIQLRIGF